MKQLNLLKTMFLLCALIVGSNAWAEEHTIILDYSSFSLTNSYAKKTATVDGFGFTVDQGYKGSGNTIQMNSTKGSGTLYNTTAISGLKSIKVNVYSGNKTYTITTGTIQNPTANSQTGTTGGTYLAASGDTYFQLRVSGASYFSSIEITYDDGPADTRTATTVEIDGSGLNNNIFLGEDAGTLAATVKADETPIEGAVTWIGSNNDVATIDYNTGAITLVATGTVTFTAYYEGDEDYKPSTNTYELTVINENPNAITLWSEDFNSYDANDVPDGGDYSYECQDGGSATKVYDQTLAGGSGKELLVGKATGYFQATIPLHNVDGEMTLTFKTNNSNLNVSSSTDGVTLDGDTHAKNGGTSTVTISGITADMTSLVLVFANSYSNNCRLDDIVLKGSLTTPATMSVKGLASFASPYPLDLADLPEGLKAYKASLATGGVVTLDEVTAAVPAGTGLILKGTANESYNIPVVASADELTGNLLVGVKEAAGKTVGDNEAYALSKTDGKFHMVTSGLTIPQGKAYLPATNLSAHELVLSFVDGETTAINEVKGLKADVRGEYFNLNGQRVAQPTKGLYIVNGKKVVIR